MAAMMMPQPFGLRAGPRNRGDDGARFPNRPGPSIPGPGRLVGSYVLERDRFRFAHLAELKRELPSLKKLEHDRTQSDHALDAAIDLRADLVGKRVQNIRRGRPYDAVTDAVIRPGKARNRAARGLHHG